MDDSNRGFGLTDGGYYFAISDQMDLKVRGDIFTKGSWALNTESNYVKRYKYSGLFQASYQVTKTGDKGLPDYSVARLRCMVHGRTEAVPTSSRQRQLPSAVRTTNTVTYTTSRPCRRIQTSRSAIRALP